MENFGSVAFGMFVGVSITEISGEAHRRYTQYLSNWFCCKNSF
jgi:hypothetical protein